MPERSWFEDWAGSRLKIALWCGASLIIAVTLFDSEAAIFLCAFGLGFGVPYLILLGRIFLGHFNPPASIESNAKRDGN